MTDAPLQMGSVTDKPCGKCHVFLDARPMSAIKGVEYPAGESREGRFDVKNCRDYRKEHRCGVCAASCRLARRQVRCKREEKRAERKALGARVPSPCPTRPQATNPFTEEQE